MEGKMDGPIGIKELMEEISTNERKAMEVNFMGVELFFVKGTGDDMVNITESIPLKDLPRWLSMKATVARLEEGMDSEEKG